MKKNSKNQFMIYALFVLFLVFLASVFANETNANATMNLTTLSTNTTNTTASSNVTNNSTASENSHMNATNSTSTNSTFNSTNSTTNLTSTAASANQTAVEPVFAFEFLNITPSSVPLGDTIFTVNVKNTGTVTLKNLLPTITGKGFATYDAIPISSLEPQKIGTSYVTGYTSKEGDVLLTIRINDQTYYQLIHVAAQSTTVNLTSQQEKQEKEEAQKKLRLTELNAQVNEMKQKYEALEKELNEKEEDYHVKDVELTDLKKYLTEAQSNLLSEDPDKTSISLALAFDEYNHQRRNLDESKKKSWGDKIKDNILLISTIAGAMITVITLYEIVKKKQEGLYKKIKEIKIDDTKITVSKKKSSPKAKQNNSQDEKNEDERETYERIERISQQQQQ